MTIAAVLMSDVAGSTPLWRRDGTEMDRAMTLLDADVHGAAAAYDGTVQTTRGEGDSHLVVFPRASSALRAAVAIQTGGRRPPWLEVRIGIHLAELHPGHADPIGLPASCTARIRGAAHGGQTLCTTTVLDVAGRLDDLTVHSLGYHRVRDFPLPIELFQIDASGWERTFPPPVTADATTAPVTTVVAVDQVGSVRRLPSTPEAVAAWQRDLIRLLRGAAAEHRGHHLKFMGDGCLVAFDDPRDALAFARSLCRLRELRLQGAVAAGLVEVVEGELTGAPLFEAAAHLKGLGAGQLWVSPVVGALLGAANPDEQLAPGEVPTGAGSLTAGS